MTIGPFGDRGELEAYLGYQYLPEPSFDIPEPIINSTNQIINANERSLITQGKQALTDVFERSISGYSDNVTHIIHLSGGIDSRTILGAVLEFVDRENIITVTLGTPGTLDYEIGQEVADVVGVENYTIDLRPDRFAWTENRLIQIASTYSRPTKLFRVVYALEHAFDQIGSDEFVYWSGFMGEALAGSHLPSTESTTWDAAIDAFIDLNYSCPRLTSDKFDPRDPLPDEPALPLEQLSYDEQLDFGVRQPYYVRPATVYRDNTETPFLNESWATFILNVPREHRLQRSLFREIISELYPDLFSVRTETTDGLSISAHPLHIKAIQAFWTVSEIFLPKLGYNRPSPRKTNLFDWDVELRRSSILQSLVKTQLQDLNDRGCVSWIDTEELLYQHQQGVNNGTEIRMLASLELFLKSNEAGRGYRTEERI